MAEMKDIYPDTKGEPDRIITCSCGASTRTTFNTQLGHNVADNPEWKYRTMSDPDADKGIGWYCGKPGHTMTAWQRV